MGAETTGPNTCEEILVQGRQDMHLVCNNPGFGSADLLVAGPRFFCSLPAILFFIPAPDSGVSQSCFFAPALVVV